MTASSIDIYDEIESLKVRTDATILAHYYHDGEIQDLADFTGDSLSEFGRCLVGSSPVVSGSSLVVSMRSRRLCPEATIEAYRPTRERWICDRRSLCRSQGNHRQLRDHPGRQLQCSGGDRPGVSARPHDRDPRIGRLRMSEPRLRSS